MGRYDNIMRFAEIRKLMHQKKHKEALKILEKIDIDKVKVVTELNLLVEVCMKNEKYEDARQFLLKVYEKTVTRRVVYKLISLSIKTGNIKMAEELYQEYIEFDKSSSDRIILRYCIDKAKNVNRETLIQYLEKLKKEDYQEEWGYELAKLYHKQGMKDACVRECSDIILWFGEGLSVEKAKLLKLHYVEGLDILSPESEKMKTPTHIVATEENIKESEEPESEEPESEEPESEEPESEEPESDEIESEEIESIEQEGKEIQEQVEESKSSFVTEALSQAEEESGPIHFVLIENNQDLLTEVIKEMAKELFRKGMLPSSQIAKISAEKLNGINIKEKAERLNNGCLLIEQAGDLTTEAVNSLIGLMKTNEDTMVVILEDNEDGINWLFKKNKKLKHWFLYNIYLPTKQKDGLI